MVVTWQEGTVACGTKGQWHVERRDSGVRNEATVMCGKKGQ